MRSYFEKLFCSLQKIVPQHQLSRLLANIAEAKTPWFKNTLIRQFIRTYDIDLSIAQREQPEQYLNFNDFFTRSLKPNARPISPDPKTLTSPADGILSQFGHITDNQFIQAKGQHYTTSLLLGGDKSLAAEFSNGSFATVYLSPSDYHRVHMPWNGKLVKTQYIPGKLFSVNRATTNGIPELFAKNERLICIFESNIGKIVVILVGAMLVAGIETCWQNHYPPNTHATEFFSEQIMAFKKGQELGRFKFGSTVVLLFNNKLTFEKHLTFGEKILLGESLAKINCTD